VDKAVTNGRSVPPQPQLSRPHRLGENEALVRLDTKPSKSQSREALKRLLNLLGNKLLQSSVDHPPPDLDILEVDTDMDD